MNLLRANVRIERGWWEMKLLDLDIVADGADENAMLRELEYTLTCEYHLAIKAGETPFVKLLLSTPTDVERVWHEDNKTMRSLSLPPEVSRALSAVLHRPKLNEFKVEPVSFERIAA